jgi:hypothetical protein
MGQFHDTELQQSETTAVSINETVSFEKQNGVGGSNVARIAILSIVAIGTLVFPLASLLSSRGHLLPKLPVFIGSRARPVNSDSAILAVDTFGLSIQAKKDSAATREVLEQAAVQHLARLHRTYSRWADTHGDLMGSLLLKLTVDATGKVVSVDSLASHVTNSTFAKTVLDDVHKWKFPKAGVEAAEITVPLLFVPKGMDPDTVVQWERKIRSAQQDETAAADLRVATKAAISEEGERTPAAMPSPSHVIRPSAIKSSTAHSAKPKKEEVLISVKTNRSVAIRENPRFSAKTVHEVDEDTQLNIVESKGDWLKVKMADAGFIGFIRKEFVSPLN